MKQLLALLTLPILFAGCWVHHSDHCYHDSHGDYWCEDDNLITYVYEAPTSTTTVIHTSQENGGGYNNNIIVVEEQDSYCSPEEPYYHDAEYCTFDLGDTCCTWQASIYGVEETYCWYDWCGWELVEVYEYY